MNRVARRSKACETCRAKKIKCDEAQPECLRCRRAGHQCPGPIRGSIFVNAGPPTKGVPQRRTTVRHGIHADEPEPREQGLGSAIVGTTSLSSLHRTDTSLSPSRAASQEAEATAVEELIIQDNSGGLSLRSCLGQGRIDPFSALPWRTSARENYLIDIYVHDIITFFGVSADVCLHPQRDICFPIIVEGAAPMAALFAYVAAWLSKKLNSPDNEARKYQVMTIRSIHNAISDPSQRFVNSTIMAILGLINIFYQLSGGTFLPEESQQLQAHVRGIRYLIEKRGGFIAICNDPNISWITVCTDLLTLGEISDGSTPLSPHALPPTGSTLSISGAKWNPWSGPYTNHLEAILHEYTGAFCNFFQEAKKRKEKCFSAAPKDRVYFLISRLFCPGIHIHRLLTNGVSIGYPRITVYFYLNALLWENRDDLDSLFNGYFLRKRRTMVEAGLDLGGSVDMFLWTLISDPTTHKIENLETLWLVARLLKMHYRLSAHLQAQVEHSLLHFLIPYDGVETSVLSPDTFYLAVKHDLDRPREQ